MVSFIPQRNNAYKWYSSKNIHVKGYLFDKENNLYRNEKLINYFKNIKDKESFEKTLREANGQFSVLIIQDDFTLVGNDRILFFPLFYTKIGNNILISDDPFYLQQKADLKSIDDVSADELLSAGYVSGKSTIIKGLYQTQAASFLYIKGNHIEVNEYYNFYVSKTSDKNYNLLKEDLTRLYHNIFKRLIHTIDNRQIAVALSGGYDSRMVAVMLKELNYNNVVCFTYGRGTNNVELESAKATAKRLGFKWVFIEYNEKLIEDYFNSDLFQKYYKYAYNFTSMFFMHEYFAVKYLKENNLVEHDAIFVPGHSADFIAGNMLLKNGLLPNEKSINKLINNILSIKYNMTKQISKKKIKEKISPSILNKFNKDHSIYLYSLFEDWDMKEKFAKFITRSTHVFHFYGYEVRTPYWDNEFIDFFKFVPFEYRLNKRLYDDVLTNFYFKKYNVNFVNNKPKLTPIILKIQHVKDTIKPFIPLKIKERFFKKIDTSAYSIITKPLLDDIIKNTDNIDNTMRGYNAIITRWLIVNTPKLIHK